MPLTPVGISGAIIPALVGTGMIGTGVAQFANGVAAGIMLWVGQLTVTTVDVGTAGVGVGLLPCAIPQPLLLAGFQSSFPASGLLGIMSPLLATGLAVGLSVAFPQGIITTTHPTVGVGTGVASFPGPSAIPSMIAGFKSVGMVGPSTEQAATAIGLGLDIAFAGFVVPVPIVGPPSPVASGGTGTGKIA